MRCIPKFNFRFCNETLWFTISQKKILNPLETLQVELLSKCLPFGPPTHILRESSILSKGYGIKCGVIGNILRNALGTLRFSVRTWCEHIRTLLAEFAKMAGRLCNSIQSAKVVNYAFLQIQKMFPGPLSCLQSCIWEVFRQSQPFCAYLCASLWPTSRSLHMEFVPENAFCLPNYK